MAVDLPESPNNREEQYLASIAGQSVEVPECPWSRKEAYLDAIDGKVSGMEEDISTLNQKVAALATDFSYKGSVADYAHLPSDAEIGDVYTTEDEGYMYVWDGAQWQILNMTGAGALTGDSDPTTSTEGTLGQLYLNTTSGELFYCSATGSAYTWVSLDSPIQSISVNGTAVTPDANKNVALTIPAESIKVLTANDYNWPTTGTKTGVAPWLLEPGAYVVGENTVVYRPKTSAGGSFVTINAGWPIFVTGKATVLAFGSLSVFDSGGGNGPYLTTFISIAQTGIGQIAFTGLTKSSFVGNNNSYVPMSISLGNQMNNTLQNKADKTAFTGTDGTADGTMGLVPAPATTDAGKFLKADGTWDTAGSSVTVVQTTGTSQTDVMSQNAVTGSLYTINTYADSPVYGVAIGDGAQSTNYGNAAWGVAIGRNSKTATNNNGVGGISIGSGNQAFYGITIGRGSQVSGTANNTRGAIAIGAGNSYFDGAGAVAEGAIAIGRSSGASQTGAIALGAHSSATHQGEMNIGSTNTTYGYNNSAYRLLTGLYDPQSAHDAATKGYVDNAVINGGTTQPTTSTVGAVGTQYNCVNSGTPEIYICTDTTGGTYTWTKVN